jgi:spore germination cell wall hydrolase CwlJ-like protein
MTEKLFRAVFLTFGFLIVWHCLHCITLTKFAKLESEALLIEEASGKAVTTRDRERQLECLAKNIYYEAGGESFEGRVGVAMVTINRANSGRFPGDICQVVYQKTVFDEKLVYQFSWLANPTRGIIIHKSAYTESYEVAKKVLLEGFRLPSLKDALYFHNDQVNPGWNRQRIAQIGHHVFYK